MKPSIIPLFFLSWVILIPPMTAESQNIPDTGQSACYDNTSIKPCDEAYAGQDAHFTIDPPAFTKMDSAGNALSPSATEWVMVRDDVTGLIWEVKKNDDTIHDLNKRFINSDQSGDPENMTKKDFIDQLNQEQFGGYSDWRLPEVKELWLLVEIASPSNEQTLEFFPNTARDESATPVYCTSHNEGVINTSTKAYDITHPDIDNTCHVRAVRGTKLFSLAFTDNGDETLTDPNTELTWQFSEPIEAKTWQDALAYCESLTLAGYTDWRLPSIHELLSIETFSGTNPFAADEGYFFSSTTDTVTPTNAIGLPFGKVDDYIGFAITGPKTDTYQVRAVRGGYPLEKVVIGAGGLTGAAPYTTTFTATFDGGSSPFTYDWQINGTSKSDAAPTQTFDTPGTYSVMLSLTDQKGVTVTDSVTITVTEPPQTLAATTVHKILVTPEEINNAAVRFDGTKLQINFPAYATPVNIYIMLYTASGVSAFLSQQNTFTASLVPYKRNLTDSVTQSIPLGAYATIKGENWIYWMLVPSNSPDFTTYELYQYAFQVDADNDGYAIAEGDCNDASATIYPYAQEICGDALDQDCDGVDLGCTQGSFDNSLGMTFINLPSGTFSMGSPASEPMRGYDEVMHTATIDAPFYIQTTEVTQAQWETVMASNPSYFAGCPSCPVEQVSWDRVQAFIVAMNQRNEGIYRLPTEKEWEYAARAGTKTAFANGPLPQSVATCTASENLDKIGWYAKNSDMKPQSVAQKQPNYWGLFDMHGNVWEWVADYYSKDPSVENWLYFGLIEPTSTNIFYVIRGGGWHSCAKDCRSAARDKLLSNLANNSVGFRLVVTP